MKLKERAKQLKTDIPAVFIAMKRKETPFLAKILAAITIVYALSPIDLIPDFIPILGYLDDLIILPFLIVLTIKLILKDHMENYRKEAENLWQDGIPKKWYYAIPFVLFWIVLLTMIILLLR